MDEMYKVYARFDEFDRLLDVNSSVFLHDTAGWVEIDEGVGQRYGHAQVYYLPGTLFDDRGIPRYKRENGRIAERTQAEMDADCEATEEQTPQQDDRIAELEKRLAAQEAELAAYREAYRQGVQSV